MESVSQDQQSFKFITGNPSQKRNRNRQREIKSHVGREIASRRRNAQPRLQSWLLINRGDESMPQQLRTELVSSTPIPPRVGSEFSWVQFPEAMKPYMLQDLTKFFTLVIDMLYPSSLCLPRHMLDSNIVGYLLSDPAFLHGALFCTESVFSQVMDAPSIPRKAFHMQRTLQLLQLRIAQSDEQPALSDATLLTVSNMALQAQFDNDWEVALNHMQGLYRIVDLRGGFSALEDCDHGVIEKICRVDLSHSLHFSCPPKFFTESMLWDSYIHKKPAGQANDTFDILRFLPSLDSKLVNAWNDLRHFSNQSNVATQTDSAFTRRVYSEIMLSVLYRLLNLSFETGTANEALRTGMLTFATSLYFQWQSLNNGRDQFGERLNAELCALKSGPGVVPVPLVFWLLMIWKTTVSETAAEREHVDYLDNIMRLMCIGYWENARDFLRRMIWIDRLCSTRGRGIIENARARLS
ncbi:hypothetical protein EDB81DRAFT_696556 [Dactylonectria macrodidyma]|uniref:Uncharacterized protein n=1 Tax=Dactylonectria macrodidyma TaxID=307937 RepID=A0A9P9E5E9_9HYPO|nr:hypothetical protein EDB81DRAFT_696556 [Dactylonectria macrodidyma]